MYANFTPQARQVMDRANDEARQWRHEYLGTEHVLFALAETQGTAQRVLQDLAPSQHIRQIIESMIQPGPDETAPGTLPHAPRLKSALNVAVQAAQRLGLTSVGTEHLLLGMLRVPDSIAARALAKLNVTFDTAQQHVQRVLGTSPALADQAKELVNAILLQAVEAGASDIHLDPTEGGGRIRLRVDGALRDAREPLAPQLFPALIDRVKTMAAVDVSQRQSPQDGVCILKIDAGNKRLDLRICVAPTFHGERAVIRILHKDPTVVSLERLGLSPSDRQTLLHLAALPSGLILVTGPTGSGKTTLLYSLLQQTNRPETSVVTVEDPVEYTFAGMAQIPINPAAGFTYSRAIRTVLRQDPDVIMVGEIRDLETLQLCVQCSLTGHLVMTTLHASTAIGAIQRILDMGLEPFLVNSTLAAAISMRLVRLLCPACKQSAQPALHLLPTNAQKYVASLPEPKFFAPKGCAQCAGRGFRGRTGVYEILVPTDELRRLISDGADPRKLLDAARGAGMRSLLEDGLAKAAAGLTTLQEVLWLAQT